ncbi:beta-ketoacyl-[acyl-carrier-protein] synthase family protein [uncultured Desulfovibrio sp.]|uniref:beta-ketoacyl-[acyl-carrier-protein] synthase family protein n=1 Tax=uncultured Desulfovibrio sp. TaxID=167968 RepID=UPI002805E2F8|nr:beta-ketoacyl-[acyl-carrier-protein] synthase family protein [uncultured Desulfovibrio sp.]
MTPGRLVITGMGAVTPLGTGVPAYWRGLVQGRCGVGPLTRFDASALPVRIAAEVRHFDEAALPRAVARNAARFMRYAFVAGMEALAQSGLDIAAAPERVGLTMGTAMAGVAEATAGEAAFLASKSGKVSPHFVPAIIGNMAAAHMAIQYGIHGPGMTLETACSAGGDAVMAAAMLLRSGEADAVLVLGGESILCPSVVSSLAQAKALSRRNDAPEAASRPFDRDRDGFVIGEGGGALLLETETHARGRGAAILALLAGWGNSLDAHHITAPDPTGEGAAACMRTALRRAGLAPDAIGYVNAHGTSTGLGDIAETAALKRVFGGPDTAPPVSSTKGATGHLMGAGGITEIIACIMAVREGILPPTLNLDTPDPRCDLDYVPRIAREMRVDAAMSNSLGFGGQNSSIIVTRPV